SGCRFVCKGSPRFNSSDRRTGADSGSSEERSSLHLLSQSRFPFFPTYRRRQAWSVCAALSDVRRGRPVTGADFMDVGVRVARRARRMRRGGVRMMSSPATAPAIEAPAAASGLEALVGRLPPHEWRRRLVHMSPGLLPSLFLVIPHAHPLTW